MLSSSTKSEAHDQPEEQFALSAVSLGSLAAVANAGEGPGNETIMSVCMVLLNKFFYLVGWHNPLYVAYTLT